MPRRRQLPPDNRPDWRDPNMPCYRNYRFGNGIVQEFVDPEYERRYRSHMISSADQPGWRNDPTYNLRKPR